MNMRLLVPFVSAVLGLAAGYLSSGSVQEPKNSTLAEVGRSAPGAEHLIRPAAPRDQDARRQEITTKLQAVGFTPSRIQRVAELTELFASLTREELLLASKSLMQITSTRRDDAATMLALRLLEIDPELALKVVRDEPGFDDNVAGRFLHEWLQQDPEAALKGSLQLVHKSQRGSFQLGSLWRIKTWAAQDPAAAAKLAVAHAGVFGQDTVNVAFASWAEKSPQDAMAEAAKLDNVRLQRSAAAAVMSQWAAKDPDRATAWLGQVQDERLRAELTVALAIGTAAVDPARSAELVRSLPEGRVRSDGLLRLAESSRGRDISESLRMAAEVPFESNNNAQKSYYSGVMHDQPALALASLLERFHVATEPEERRAIAEFLRDPPSMSWPGKAAEIARIAAATPASLGSAPGLALVLNAAAKWAGSDLAGARAWAEALPPGATRDRAFEGVAQTWAWSALPEATAWVDAEPPSSSRDAATVALVKAALQRDPESALMRLRKMKDSAAQLQALQEGWRFWSKRDADAAEKWRSSSPDLTASERASLTPEPHQP